MTTEDGSDQRLEDRIADLRDPPVGKRVASSLNDHPDFPFRNLRNDQTADWPAPVFPVLRSPTPQDTIGPFHPTAWRDLPEPYRRRRTPSRAGQAKSLASLLVKNRSPNGEYSFHTWNRGSARCGWRGLASQALERPIGPKRSLEPRHPNDRPATSCGRSLKSHRLGRVARKRATLPSLPREGVAAPDTARQCFHSATHLLHRRSSRKDPVGTSWPAGQTFAPCKYGPDSGHCRHGHRRPDHTNLLRT